jgi:hypothetical protein
MECDACSAHFCAKCLGMNDKIYAYMSDLGDRTLWRCEICTVEVRVALSQASNASSEAKIVKKLKP